MNKASAVGWNPFFFCSLPNVCFLMDNTIDSGNCLTVTAASKHIHPDTLRYKITIARVLIHMDNEFLDP